MCCVMMFSYAKLLSSSFMVSTFFSRTLPSVRVFNWRSKLVKQRRERRMKSRLTSTNDWKTAYRLGKQLMLIIWNVVRIVVVCLVLTVYVVGEEMRNNRVYFTIRLRSCFLLVDIHQLILNVWKPWHHFRRISWIIRRSCPKKKKKNIGCWRLNHLKAAKITKQQKWPAAVC